jgi:Do/DeqQ family serine protease
LAASGRHFCIIGEGHDQEQDGGTMTVVRSILAGVVLVTLTLAVQAQSRAPGSREEIRLSFAPVVKTAAPAVVNVYSRRVVRQQSMSPFFDDPFFRRFFGDRGFGIPRDRVQNSLGSGVIVAADGFIVTNHHVIKGGTEIQVVLNDRREFQAKVVLQDERTDLAVLKIDAPDGGLPFLELRDSDELQVGDLVLAIGNPFGVGQTVTSGIVSALARSRVGVSDFQSFIQTDAAINPGNSGGALIDVDGALVGINTAIFSRSGGSNGIGFAVPTNMVRVVIEAARGDGIIRRPWLGAQLQRVTPEIAESLGFDRPRGVLVQSVRPGGPAAAGGLKRGDVIVEVDGHQVDAIEEFNYRFATRPVGGTAMVGYLRGQRERQARVALEAAPEDPPRDMTELTGRQPFAGAVVANLSPALAEELRRDSDESGVVILDVRGGPAQRLGLRPGDLILAIDGSEVQSVVDVVSLTERPRRSWDLVIKRGDRVIETTVAG